jgi:hypothetical protein
MNTKLIALPERAMVMAGKWGGDVMDMVPRAGKWLETGAKLGALKAGSRVAVKFARRHPVALAATVASAGALWYLAHRAKKRAENGDGREPIEGTARRVEAKRASSTTTRRAPRKATARKTTRSRSTPAAET